MTTAVVVARAGSRRLPHKALLGFAGTTLLGHKVRQLLACSAVDQVVVGSDCREILRVAEAAGARAVRRDDYHCDEDRCTANEMIADMAGRVDGDLVLWAHPTNPLVRPETYARAVEAYQDAVASGSFDSLASVTTVRRHCWVEGRPHNHHPWSMPHQPAARLRPCYRFQNGAIFIQPRAAMLANEYFYGYRPVLFEIDAVEAWDIDTAEDFAAAVALWDAGCSA